MEMAVDQIESICLIEPTADRVLLEYVELQEWPRLARMVHESTPDAPALAIGLDE
jgi:hypothetical protein